MDRNGGQEAMKLRTGILATLATGTGFLAFQYLRHRPLDLNRKVVLITGGSRGLGLATAREFGSRGATVAICARDREELELAQEDLSQRGVTAAAFPCDITDREQVQRMVAAVTECLGAIDILVNNAGVIKVAPFAEMKISDFEQALNLMFWGMLYVILEVLPTMRTRRNGSIVNITSIGGKLSIPHLLPYSCAKFAAVGLSEGLRAELAPAGIRVTTIVPGLLRTGSHLHAQFKGKREQEYAWFTAGATTPLVAISAERAARSIVDATVRGQSEKILSVPAYALAQIHGLAPALSAAILTMMNQFLPGKKPGSAETADGQSMESSFTSKLWKTITALGQNAAVSLNEIPTSEKPSLPSEV
jgi:NAD(P)-dependent dehydrogenase (short-subunit alcohol dehydrogenase family)